MTKSIAIYGVGRSGTKALLLACLNTILLSEEKCRVNYEPYYWTGSLGNLNYSGIRHNFSREFFINSLSRRHAKFIKDLDQQNIPCITKFIRANDLINPISNLLSPNTNFLIVRNLYDALSSVIRHSWDYYQMGSYHLALSHLSMLNSMIDDALKNDLISKKRSLQFKFTVHQKHNSRINGNAIYWYLMNKAALQNIKSNTIVLRYDKQGKFLAKASDLITQRLELSKNVSSDILSRSGTDLSNTSIYNITPVKKHSAILSHIDQLLYMLTNKTIGYKGSIFSYKCGEIYSLKKNCKLPTQPSFSDGSIAINQNSFLDELNDEILFLLEESNI